MTYHLVVNKPAVSKPSGRYLYLTAYDTFDALLLYIRRLEVAFPNRVYIHRATGSYVRYVYLDS